MSCKELRLSSWWNAVHLAFTSSVLDPGQAISHSPAPSRTHWVYNWNHDHHSDSPQKTPSRALCQIAGYQLACCDRKGRHEGVAVFVGEALPAAEKAMDGDLRSLELRWIRVELSNRPIFVRELYHPKTNIQHCCAVGQTWEYGHVTHASRPKI